MTDRVKVIEEMRAVAEDLVVRSEELCKLDSYVGDGDHGISIRKGFSGILGVLDQPTETIEDVFNLCLDAILDNMGGAIGPIFASVFMGFGAASAGKEVLTAADWQKCFERGLQVVMEVGGAKPGERTLVDTLNAAVEAFRETEGKSDEEIWKHVAKRSYEGAQNTKNMQARKGRARYLAERSVGYVDAGSMSMNYFIQAIAKIECPTL